MSVPGSGSGGGPFRLDIGTDGIAVVTIDCPGEVQNTLRAEAVDAAHALLDRLGDHDGLRGVVFISGKPGSFIAGADIRMLAACTSAEQARSLSEAGQRICSRIERFPVPVVAAIDGICLGGGLELSLACHGRIATTEAHTRLGLPEVMLGLLPGSGGTQRLPRVIGLRAALDLMLTGQQVEAAQALRLGLVDEAVPAPILLDAARKRVQALATSRRRPGPRRSWMARVASLLLEGNAVGRALVLRAARRRVQARTHGNYPAPGRIIDAVGAAWRGDRDAGYAEEARGFGALAVSPQARELIYLYFATTAMKKDTGADGAEADPRPVRRIGVLGAGLMGAGIAYVSTARAGLPVRLKDRDDTSLARGMAAIHRLVERRRRRGSITAFEAQRELGRVTPTTDGSGFGSADLVIEAVFEDLDLKRRMVREMEAICPAHAIFASNTSSIPIARLADGAARPANVIGMHYFSPVDRMPLLEVVTTPQTAPEVVATAVQTGRRQGKTVIVVRDGAGFYVNRMLAPYINAACRLLQSGATVDAVDRALVRFGFPVGPFALLDEVGIDVAAKVGAILAEAFGARMQAPDLAARMVQEGRLGRKSGRGFYRYSESGRGDRKPDPAVRSLTGQRRAPGAGEGPDLAEYCLLPMLNETARCLDEGIIRSARDGDVGAVYGIGFPPFRGGPFRYLDRLGAAHVCTRLDALAAEHGPAYEAAPVLRRLAGAGGRFHPQ